MHYGRIRDKNLFIEVTQLCAKYDRPASSRRGKLNTKCIQHCGKLFQHIAANYFSLGQKMARVTWVNRSFLSGKVLLKKLLIDVVIT